ncbi:MAG: hypothetical protein M1818_006138 [Claussenomyces sp. TS43310]|nr:MAG: hypothetical protein M1818_006138 [Claussenomyces sp. TS43310]
MPSLPLRIAMLECGVPLGKTRAKYGGYGAVFGALLKAAADNLQYPKLSSSSGLDISSFDVTEFKYPSLDTIDAILITGSKFNAFDNDPWIVKLVDFVKEILAQDRVRIIGVCFGHQIVGRALGCKVDRCQKGWEVSVTAIDLTKRGQEIFGRPALALHQMHRDMICEHPEGVEELAYTDKCSVHAMYVPKRFICVQGHPEFNEEIVREIMEARHEAGIFDDEEFKDAIDRVDKYHDGVVVAQAFLRLLLE